MIGVDILSQLSSPTEIRPFSKQVFDIFIELLQYEKTPSILMSILYGIGHNSENLVLEKDIELIASYKASEHSCIREGVVFALIGIDNRIAIEALVELSKDKYCFIRDWAVFGLGSLIDTDNTLIREALYERLFDKHQKTKEEAIVGLARRKDLRVKNIIKQELLSKTYGHLLFDAIEELPNITFQPLLEDDLLTCKTDADIGPRWIEDLEKCIENLKASNSPAN